MSFTPPNAEGPEKTKGIAALDGELTHIFDHSSTIPVLD